MNANQLRKLCTSLPGVTEQIQWGDDRVFKIGGKMFACSGLETDSRYAFKVEDGRFLELTDREGVTPAPYLARAKWVQIDPADCDIPDADLKELVKTSYELVFARLSKKLQKALRLGSDHTK